MIVKMESGSRRLDALELSRIASALQLPLAHFLTPAPAVLSRRAALIEDIDTEVDRSAYRLEAELASWLRDLRQLIDLGLLEQAKPMRYSHPVSANDEAREAAIWLRTELGEGSGPLGPLIEVCGRAGQLLLVSDVPGDGASVLDGDLAAAIVSFQSEPGRRRSTAAHELGHLVIGDEYSTDLGVHSSRDDRERAVDVFAAEFLVPAETVREAVSHSTTLDDIRTGLVRVAAVYRASWSLVLRQAEHAQALDERQRLVSRPPTRAELMDAVGWTPAPDLHDVRVPPSVASAVMAGVRQGLITPQRAAEISRGADQRLRPQRLDQRRADAVSSSTSGSARALVFDTMVLSAFAKADRLDLFGSLLAGSDCFMTDVVRDWRSEKESSPGRHSQLSRPQNGSMSQALPPTRSWLSFFKWSLRIGSQAKEIWVRRVSSRSQIFTQRRQ